MLYLLVKVKEYQRNRYQSMSDEQKEKLKEYRKNYYRAKCISLTNEQKEQISKYMKDYSETDCMFLSCHVRV